MFNADILRLSDIQPHPGMGGRLFGAGGFVFATYVDSEGDVWMGGVKGNVYCCNAIDGKLRTYDTQPVYCFAELSPGQIYWDVHMVCY